MAQTTKVITKKKKFFSVEIPIIGSEIELVGDTLEALNNRTVKLDLTRQLRGKSVEAVLKVKTEKNSATASPIKMVLMPYFIRRMIRKRISYIEDSFNAPTQESLMEVKPFLITRNKVSRAVRKTLRNLTKNWIEDYLAERKDEEVFDDLLTNRLQKPLSLKLKKTYPLSLCEIRILRIIRPLKSSEIPKSKKSDTSEESKEIEKKKLKIEEGLDQFAEIEEEKIKKAQKEIKETQEKALEVEKEEVKEKVEEKTEETQTKKEKKPRKPRKTKEKTEEKTEEEKD